MTIDSEKLACLVLCFGILGQAYVVRRWVGTWAFPACIYGVAWFAFTFVPLVLIISAPVNFWAIFYIFFSCLVFSSGSLFFGDWREGFQVRQQLAREWSDLYNTRLIRTLFWTIGFVSIISFVINSFVQGFTLRDLVLNFFESAAAYAHRRGGNELVESVFVQIGNLTSYTTAALGGLVFVHERGPRRLWVLFFAMLSAIFVMLTQSAKGMLLVSAALFFAGVLIARLQESASKAERKGSLRVLLITGAVVLPIIVISFMSRSLYKVESSDVVTDTLLGLFASYTLCHIFGFSDWFSWYIGSPSVQFYHQDSLTYGLFTFQPILRILGVTTEVPPGYYGEYYSYGTVMMSNIYTYYRGLIIDYGILGSLEFVFGFSFLSHFMFKGQLRAATPVISASFFIVVTAFVLNSQLISLFIWWSAYGVFVALACIFYLNAYLYRRSKITAADPDASDAATGTAGY